ncbi:hypothetical protein RIF29_12630 [Crotalaria pallida]|uniref:Uncharacterized protein n=1 Tax=Crotalaria pallida TaxID=3830 RepID=A0AAN9IND5_CROPI
MQKEQRMHEKNIDAKGASASGAKNQENAPTTTENMASALELVKELLDEAPIAPDVAVIQNEPAKHTEEVIQSGSQGSISRVSETEIAADSEEGWTPVKTRSKTQKRSGVQVGEVSSHQPHG